MHGHYNTKYVQHFREALEANKAVVFHTPANEASIRGAAYRFARENGRKARTRKIDSDVFVWFSGL